MSETINSLRFARGFITEFEVSCFQEKDKALFEIMPTFIMTDENFEIENTEDLFNLIYKEGDKNYEVTIKGYNFLSDKITTNKYEKVFSEPLIGLVSFNALRKINFKDLEFWEFKSLENKILTTTTKE